MSLNPVNNERIHESVVLHKQERKESSCKQMQTNIKGVISYFKLCIQLKMYYTE